MLPEFNQSCVIDTNCMMQGWSILVHASEATLCNWQSAKDSILALPPSVYETAGGNGQSLSNSLWWIATRPCP